MNKISLKTVREILRDNELKNILGGSDFVICGSGEYKCWCNSNISCIAASSIDKAFDKIAEDCGGPYSGNSFGCSG